MSWQVVLRPKRKNDVHGVAVVLVNPKLGDLRDFGEEFEATRVAFWRRSDTAAQHKKKFEEVLQEEIHKAEQVVVVLDTLESSFAEARSKALAEARAEIGRLFPRSSAGTRPEFE